jgi:hypothetical protein
MSKVTTVLCPCDIKSAMFNGRAPRSLWYVSIAPKYLQDPKKTKVWQETVKKHAALLDGASADGPRRPSFRCRIGYERDSCTRPVG